MDFNCSDLFDAKPLLMLEFAKFRLEFEVKQTVETMKIIPMLRSRLGFILKQRFCTFINFKEKKCSGCINSKQCLYLKLFSPTTESVDEKNKGKGNPQLNPPRPFILSVPGVDYGKTLRTEQKAFIDLGIFGKEAIKQRRPLLESISLALESYDFIKPFTWYSITPDPENQKFQKSFHNKSCEYPLSDWIKSFENKPLDKTENNFVLKLDFTSPFQMKRLDHEFQFPGFIKSVVARLRDLKRIYHPDNDMGSFSKNFYTASNQIEAFSNLKYVKNFFYSSHRGKDIKLGGLMGGLIFTGELEPFIPLMAAGFFTGVGKKTIYGLGRYDLCDFDNQLRHAGEK